MPEILNAINACIVYAPADRTTRKDLDLYLSILKRQGYIHSLEDRKITIKSDEKVNGTIDESVKRYDIILILVSDEILESGYFQGPEYKIIQDRTLVDKLDLVFIITSPCRWEQSISREKTIILPEGGRPISDPAWETEEIVYNQIFKALKPIITKRKEIKEAETQKRIRKAETLIIQAPGGPLIPNALNYIERSADKQLMKLLGTTYAPMTLITGGIQSGKTSLLNRFIHKAREDQKLKIISVDFNNLPKNGNHRFPGSIFAFLLEKVFEDLTGEKPMGKNLRMETFDEATAADWAIDKLNNLLTTYLNPDEEAVLMIDSIDSLLGTEPTIENFERKESLVRLLAGLRNRQTEVPFNRLTVIAVFTVLKYFAAYISPLRSQVNNIPVPFFTLQEVGELIKQHVRKEEFPADAVSTIFALFAGQPYLTHQAVYTHWHSDISFTNIRQEALNLEKNYGNYWKNLRNILKFSSNAVQIKSLDILFNALLSGERTINDDRIIRNLLEPLQILGVIDSDSQVSCEFIRNAMQKELGKNETV